ncbi:hypothetical protein BKA70DRAFT_1218045 [Coprinopsis sp. MPI-PUGE-AT-0042]|nr:hypothetical protein BKA70DRAFT_1218045 [Coprinopsis sp. MPI-PUGE-AT-0042]
MADNDATCCTCTVSGSDDSETIPVTIQVFVLPLCSDVRGDWPASMPLQGRLPARLRDRQRNSAGSRLLAYYSGVLEGRQSCSIIWLLTVAIHHPSGESNNHGRDVAAIPPELFLGCCNGFYPSELKQKTRTKVNTNEVLRSKRPQYPYRRAARTRKEKEQGGSAGLSMPVSRLFGAAVPSSEPALGGCIAAIDPFRHMWARAALAASRSVGAFAHRIGDPRSGTRLCALSGFKAVRHMSLVRVVNDPDTIWASGLGRTQNPDTIWEAPKNGRIRSPDTKGGLENGWRNFPDMKRWGG